MAADTYFLLYYAPLLLYTYLRHTPPVATHGKPHRIASCQPACRMPSHDRPRPQPDDACMRIITFKACSLGWSVGRSRSGTMQSGNTTTRSLPTCPPAHPRRQASCSALRSCAVATWTLPIRSPPVRQSTPDGSADVAARQRGRRTCRRLCHGPAGEDSHCSGFISSPLGNHSSPLQSWSRRSPASHIFSPDRVAYT